MIPRHNIHAVANNTFFYIGKMIATYVQGGEVPSCFSKACAVYVVHDRV